VSAERCARDWRRGLWWWWATRGVWCGWGQQRPVAGGRWHVWRPARPQHGWTRPCAGRARPRVVWRSDLATT
jgi:hypothetical protein